MAVITNMYTVI